MAQSLQGGDPEWLVEAGEVQELLEGVEAPELLRSGVHDPRVPNGWALERSSLREGENLRLTERPSRRLSSSPERANAIAPPTCGRLKGFVAQGLSPNGDGSEY